MISFAEKNNKGNENPFKLDLKGYDFTSLKELYNTTPTINILSYDKFCSPVQ